MTKLGNLTVDEARKLIFKVLCEAVVLGHTTHTMMEVAPGKSVQRMLNESLTQKLDDLLLTLCGETGEAVDDDQLN